MTEKLIVLPWSSGPPSLHLDGPASVPVRIVPPITERQDASIFPIAYATLPRPHPKRWVPAARRGVAPPPARLLPVRRRGLTLKASALVQCARHAMKTVCSVGSDGVPNRPCFSMRNMSLRARSRSARRARGLIPDEVARLPRHRTWHAAPRHRLRSARGCPEPAHRRDRGVRAFRPLGAARRRPACSAWRP